MVITTVLTFLASLREWILLRKFDRSMQLKIGRNYVVVKGSQPVIMYGGVWSCVNFAGVIAMATYCAATLCGSYAKTKALI